MIGQTALPLSWPVSYDEKDYITAPCNETAFRFVKAPESWASPILTIIGPEGSGKTHLAHMFMHQHEAVSLDSNAAVNKQFENSGEFAFVDDIDKRLEKNEISQEMLFHAVNCALQEDRRLLLFATKEPKHWALLPDLLSRINANTVLGIQHPEGDLIKETYRKLFAERGLLPDQKVLDYLTIRSERSFSAMIAVVQKLDNAALEQSKSITIPFIQSLGIFK